MRVLVTGASGFVGGWLTQALVDEGHQVRVMVRNPKDIEDLELLKIEVVTGDITDIMQVTSAAQDIDTIFHLAGAIAYSRLERENMERVNVGGTANVISACKTNKVRRLVHFSSVVTIGSSYNPHNVLNENSKYNLSNLNLGYFETKRKAENLVFEAVRRGEIDAVCVNPTTIYGPGDEKKPSRGVQKKVARGTFPFYTSGGVNVVSIEDVIYCTIKAWQIGKSGERYIIAGENLTIKKLFEQIAYIAGVKPPKIYIPNFLIKLIGRIGDIQAARGKHPFMTYENAVVSTLFHWFDSSKAQKVFGFKPKPASYCLRQSIEWSRRNAPSNASEATTHPD